MSRNPLIAQIDNRLSEAVADVLVLAAESVGECTYAAHLAGYLAAKKGLKVLRTSGWSMDPYRNQGREYRLMSALRHHHREMYRQPCLICEACQNRVKFWRAAPYSTFGDRLLPVDEFRDDDTYPAVHPVLPPYFVDYRDMFRPDRVSMLLPTGEYCNAT